MKESRPQVTNKSSSRHSKARSSCRRRRDYDKQNDLHLAALADGSPVVCGLDSSLPTREVGKGSRAARGAPLATAALVQGRHLPAMEAQRPARQWEVPRFQRQFRPQRLDSVPVVLIATCLLILPHACYSG